MGRFAVGWPRTEDWEFGLTREQLDRMEKICIQCLFIIRRMREYVEDQRAEGQKEARVAVAKEVGRASRPKEGQIVVAETSEDNHQEPSSCHVEHASPKMSVKEGKRLLETYLEDDVGAPIGLKVLNLFQPTDDRDWCGRAAKRQRSEILDDALSRMRF